MTGWVYVITNDSLPELVKIGFTTRHPRERAKELQGTNVPGSFAVEYAALVEQPRKLESEVHKHLSSLGLRADKEWFHCDVGVAVWSIKKNALGEISRWYSDEADQARIEADVQQALYRKRLADREKYEENQRTKNAKQEISQCLDKLRKKRCAKSAETARKTPVVFDYRVRLEAMRLHLKVLVGLCVFFCLWFTAGMALDGEVDRWEKWALTFGMGSFYGVACYLLAVVTGAISSRHKKRVEKVEARKKELLLPVQRLFPHLEMTTASYQKLSDRGETPGFLAPIPTNLQNAIGGKARMTGNQFSGTLRNSTQEWIITLAVLRLPLHYEPCSFRLPICVLPGEEEEFALSINLSVSDGESKEDFSWSIYQIYGYNVP